ncbi:hypothetical protein F5X97DRAFT_35509 [Nemania serpens]|nr:hypothetical protein F5X97DRAFT_35509 [Nemania serpens]
MAERGTAKKWTEDEKILFLVRAVQDMQANGAKLSYAKVSDKMTGRTPKALTHLWEKLSKDYANTADDAAAGTSAAAAGTAADGQPDPSTPANKRGKAAPGGRKRAQETAATGEDGAADEVQPTPATKRSRKSAGAKPKAKAAASAPPAVEEDEDEDDGEDQDSAA